MNAMGVTEVMIVKPFLVSGFLLPRPETDDELIFKRGRMPKQKTGLDAVWSVSLVLFCIKCGFGNLFSELLGCKNNDNLMNLSIFKLVCVFHLYS